MKKIIKKIKDTVQATLLCIKYPFLYPRNRFSGLHYTNWKINSCLDLLNKKTYKYIGNIGDKDNPYHKEINNYFYLVILYFIRFIYDYVLQCIFCLTSHTELDAMDTGWRKAFGLDMCKEIKASLLKTGGIRFLYSYRILQIKEKYGSLRWYDSGCTDDLLRIIDKYEKMSAVTCVTCGEPAEYRTTSWVCPYSEKHIPKVDLYYESYEKIEKTDI